MIKPFALFVGDEFYPGGGWYDFVGFFETMDEAVAAAVEPENDCVSGWWFNVADLRSGEIVAKDSGLPTRWRATGEPDDPEEEAAPADPDDRREDEGTKIPDLDEILGRRGDTP